MFKLVRPILNFTLAQDTTYLASISFIISSSNEDAKQSQTWNTEVYFFKYAIGEEYKMVKVVIQ